MPQILTRNSFKGCHIILPDVPEPVSAIFYDGKFYSYVRLYPSLEEAQRGLERSLALGNAAVLTQVRKGLILWVLESDARLASKRRI